MLIGLYHIYTILIYHKVVATPHICSTDVMVVCFCNFSTYSRYFIKHSDTFRLMIVNLMQAKLRIEIISIQVFFFNQEYRDFLY